MKKIGIIGAMQLEIDFLLSLMKEEGAVKAEGVYSLLFYSGHIKKREVILVKSGVGKVNAAFCASLLIRVFHADVVINTGIAGALQEGMKVFDVVASTEACYHDVDASVFGYKMGEVPQMESSLFKADSYLLEKAWQAFASNDAFGNIAFYKGRVVSGDSFVSDKEKKHFIRETFSASCVEMEGAAIAHVCFLCKIPFLILRVMSDMADEAEAAPYKFNEQKAAEISGMIVGKLLEAV